MKKYKNFFIYFNVIIGGLCVICICKNHWKTIEPTTIFKMDNLYNGDAKFFKDNYVVTQIGGKLSFIDNSGTIVKQHEDIEVNWCDAYNDGTIIYANSKKEVGICKVDDKLNIIENNCIMNISEDLGIDPSICKINDTYYITVTHITGNINNSDENIENGLYTVKLYSSQNLKNWEFVSNIISINNNIEDVEVKLNNNKMLFVYEKESVDKGKSSINIKISSDMGITWGDEIKLIDTNADNEPAYFGVNDDGYCLYYSSDIENVGSTYNGAKVYGQYFDDVFKKEGKQIEIELNNNKGNLLYDVKESEEGIKCLFTQNYLTESNLILESTAI